MDPQRVSALFATTFNPDPNVRIAAELQLREALKQEGLLSAVVQIIGAHGVDLSVRQAAVVYLKNFVVRSYGATEAILAQQLATPPIHDSDRQEIKQNIVPLIVAAPNRAIRIQLAAILRTLVLHDFPEKWPGFMDNVAVLLRGNQPESVFGGMTALLEIFRAFRYRPVQSQTVLPKIVETTFPILVDLGSKAVANPTAPESADFLHLILKTYRNSLQQQLSAHQQSMPSLSPWGHLFFAVINVQAPVNQIPEDLPDRETCPWWKAKKWAYDVLNFLFTRYGNSSELRGESKKRYGEFAKRFNTAFAPQILSTYLHQVELNVSGGAWLSKRVTYHIIQFFQQSAKAKSTWQVLKPHIQGLVSSFVFPLMVFTNEKAEEWASDPVEYIRFDLAEFEDNGTPFGMATVFVHGLATTRTFAVFEPMLAFIDSILSSPTSTPQSRFGAHRMTACLANVISKHPEAKQAMESHLFRHVLPELNSKHAYLRAAACELVAALMDHGYEFSKEENLEQLARAVVHAFDDPQLPVRVHAALALAQLVEQPLVREALKPMISKIIQDLLRMANDTDLDALNGAMQTFVGHFSEDLKPISIQLTTRLVELYMRLFQETLGQEESLDLMDEVSEKRFTAIGSIRTMSTILHSMSDSTETLIQLSGILLPVVLVTLENEALDYFEYVFELMDTLTFSLRQITPAMWSVFEAMYKAFKGPAVDFLEEMLSALDNYICFGKDVFVQRPDYRQSIVDIYITSLTSEHLGELDAVNGCKLMESLLLNVQGCLDDAISTIIEQTLAKSATAKTKALELHLLNVLISALLYNPALSLHVLRPNARPVFDRWFVALRSDNALPRVHDKKLSLLAFCALLKLERERVPAELQEGWVGIVGGILTLLEQLPKAVENRKQLEEDFPDDDLELDDEDDINMADNDEDVHDKESAYLERLAEERERLHAKQVARAAAGSSEEDSESDDDSVGEDLGFESPLEGINPYIAFKYALAALQQVNAPAYQAATTSLTAEQTTLLMEMMALAETAEQEQGA